MQPSRAEDEAPTEAVNDLNYCLYGRQDAAKYNKTFIHKLAYRISQAQLCSTELSHLVARRDVELVKLCNKDEAVRRAADEHAICLSTH